MIHIQGVCSYDRKNPVVSLTVPQIAWQTLTLGKLLGHGGYGDVYHRTLMSPYYHDSIIKVMRTLLDQVDSDVIDDLSHEFFELPPLGLPLLPQPLADTPTQQLADQWADVYKKDLLSSEADRSRFIAQLTQLVKKGRPLCAKESDYAIHHQQFNYYCTLSYFDRLDALAELTYGLARIVELVADTQDTPKRRDFFARLEAILGKPANLPTQQAA